MACWRAESQSKTSEPTIASFHFNLLKGIPVPEHHVMKAYKGLHTFLISTLDRGLVSSTTKEGILGDLLTGGCLNVFTLLEYKIQLSR